MSTTERPTTRWQMRVQRQDAELVAEAAAALGVTRTDFVVNAATERARDVMADRTHWDVTAEQWEAFQAALDEWATSHRNATIRPDTTSAT